MSLRNVKIKSVLLEKCLQLWRRYITNKGRMFLPICDIQGHSCNTGAKCKVKNIMLQIHTFDESSLRRVVHDLIKQERKGLDDYSDDEEDEDEGEGIDANTYLDYVNQEFPECVLTVNFDEGGSGFLVEKMGFHYCTEFCPLYEDPDYRFLHLNDVQHPCFHYSDIWLCKDSGKIHKCDEDCKETTIETTEEQEHLCCMSMQTKSRSYQASFGDGVRESSATRDFNKSYVENPLHMQKRRKKSSSMSKRDVDGSTELNGDARSKRPGDVAREHIARVKIIKAERERLIMEKERLAKKRQPNDDKDEDDPEEEEEDEEEQYPPPPSLVELGIDTGEYKVCYNVINDILFSTKREQKEKEKKIAARDNARKATVKYIKNLRKDKKVIHLSNVLDLYRETAQSGQYVFPRLITQPHITHRLTEYYSLMCIAFRNNLAKYIPEFDEPISMCIIPFLHMMKTELSDETDRTQILPSNTILDTFLPETNQVCEYGITRPQFTSIKKKVKALIDAAISKKKISPSNLSVKQLSSQLLYFSPELPIRTLFVEINSACFDPITQAPSYGEGLLPSSSSTSGKQSVAKGKRKRS